MAIRMISSRALTLGPRAVRFSRSILPISSALRPPARSCGEPPAVSARMRERSIGSAAIAEVRVLVPDEGDEPSERARVLLVAEEDIHQGPFLLLPPRAVDDGHGDDGDGDVEGLLGAQELDEGVGRAVALRAPEVDHGTAANAGQAVEDARRARLGRPALQQGADCPRGAPPER